MSFDFDALLDGENTLDAFNKPTRQEDVVYKPKAADGKDNVYKSVIRFIPWYKNPKKSIIEKWTGWMEDPTTGKGRYVDCPSSVGQESPLFRMWKKLKDSENPYEREMSKIFSRRLNCYCLVQVIKDSHNPELEGKIKVFKFGKKLKDKIEAEINPEIGEPRDPFNLLKGRRFVLHITKQGEWDNYDNSKFDGEPYPIIHTADGNIDIREAIDDPSVKKTAAEWLEKNSPDLEEFGFKEWDETTTELVNSVIRSVTNSSGHAISSTDDIMSTPKPSKKATTVASINDILDDEVVAPAKAKTETKKATKVEDINLDDIDLDMYGNIK
jgi:hypothetical protein